MDISQKVALVTGGGTGLGRVMSESLAQRGAIVWVNYSRSAQDAEDTAESIRTAGGTAFTVQADVSQSADVNRMFETIAEQSGGVDILIANAGTTVFRDFGDLDGVSEEDWEHVFDVNVKGTWLTARRAAAQMKMRGGGRIVTISSVAGLRAQGSSLPYCASKASVIHMTRVLAKALAPEILVNSVAPGLLDTRWSRGHNPATIASFLKNSPLHTIPTLDDVANQVIALVETTSMTGQVVVVDAGVSL
ncbi:SDR family NAD(P)-dependent oxidoreductase [Sulfobacillus harzensis]|uniref:SDR family oxidoreductase n=1 Tax=Sulfobacillus harzensis TaxID=2729629 RepID=A0A7Y0L164_9FIRM|nr:SDR family NAD(P)-dependent oxidoreductase [Sulfobacillus harzensis]NMP21398.1 SDR family oxidoreductase [Sulfobacillus harzensis]